MKCDACGKEIEGAPWTAIKPAGTDAEKQFGEYEVREYYICAECALKSLGVPAPAKPTVSTRKKKAS